MPISVSKSYYGEKNITTNANQVLSKITRRLNEFKEGVKDQSEIVAREFAYSARQRLKDSKYNVDHLLKNIIWVETDKEKGWYKVTFADNSDRDKMYYLEYGTGFVGEGSMPDPKGNKSIPHPLAGDVGWEYAIGAKIKIPLKPNGKDGWTYKNGNGQWTFTSGLRAVAYMYNTFKEFENSDKVENIIKQSKIHSIIKDGK